MEGTFPTLYEKTRQDRAGRNQSGNWPLGRSALSRVGRTGGGGEAVRPGGTSQAGSAGGRAGSSFEDLKGLFGPRTFPVGRKAQWGLSVPSPPKQSPPLHWRLTLQRTAVTVFCACVSVCLCSKQLAPHEAQEQQELRACLRWHRLQDEVQNSPEEMQVLR